MSVFFNFIYECRNILCNGQFLIPVEKSNIFSKDG